MLDQIVIDPSICTVSLSFAELECRFRCLGSLAGAWLREVEREYGRSHQVRAA